MAIATFGAGCFWGVEAAFRKVDGVLDTAVGYMGGTLDNPTYHDVCTDTTGHVEVVQVTYDPARVSYQRLLDLFFDSHDPTTLNRQGPDVGSQYRSAVFFHDEEQRAVAGQTIEDLDKQPRFGRPLVTDVVAASAFWRAEEYHQRYLEKRGLATCSI